MRIRNGAGAVVAYRGQTAAAGVGTVTIEIPSLTGQDVALAANATWLNTAGGAPAGYQRYSDDAFAVDFTLPASVGITTATAAVMTLAVRDLADAALDSNPATAADWSAGHWIRYENVTGEDIDYGWYRLRIPRFHRSPGGRRSARNCGDLSRRRASGAPATSSALLQRRWWWPAAVCDTVRPRPCWPH